MSNQMVSAATARQNMLLQKKQLLEAPGTRQAVEKALPSYLKNNADRMIRIAFTALQNNLALAKCTDASIVKCVIEACQLGLEVNSPLGLAYLIPYKDECTLQIGYKGYIQLAYRSGKVKNISAEVVYENDQFAVQLGTNRSLHHVPAMGDRGKPLGAYTVASLVNGYHDFEYMTADEIGAIKARSPGAKKDGSPWNHKRDYLEMWRKTPIRRIAKRLPMLSEEFELLRAAVLDDEYEKQRAGELPAPPPAAPATISEDQRRQIIAAANENEVGVKELLNSFGFEMLADVTLDAFEAVLAAAQGKPAQDTSEVVNDEQAATGGESEAIQGEVVDSPPEREGLLENIDQLLRLKVGEDPVDQQEFLQGRVLATETIDGLETIRDTLRSM